jgi:hypothetical protein
MTPTTAHSSLEPFADRRQCAKSDQSSGKPEGEVCANCGHWAPLIVTSAIRPKRTKQELE